MFKHMILQYGVHEDASQMLMINANQHPRVNLASLGKQNKILHISCPLDEYVMRKPSFQTGHGWQNNLNKIYSQIQLRRIK